MAWKINWSVLGLNKDKTKTKTKTFKEGETWYVRWYSRYGEYSGDVKPEIAVFPDKESAKEFEAELKAAYKLLRHTSGTRVIVQSEDY